MFYEDPAFYISLAALLAAGISLLQSRRSNRIAEGANELSRGANTIAQKALGIEEERREEERRRAEERKKEGERAEEERKRRMSKERRQFNAHYSMRRFYILIACNQKSQFIAHLEQAYLKFFEGGSASFFEHFNRLEELGYVEQESRKSTGPSAKCSITELGKEALRSWDTSHKGDGDSLFSAVRNQMLLM